MSRGAANPADSGKTDTPGHADDAGNADGPARGTARARARGGDFRQRLLDGLAEEIAQGSYRTSTVAGIVRRAQTSRRTFYQYFTDRDQCFLVLMTEATAEMIRQVSSAVDRRAPWPDQVRAAVEAWFRYAEAEPAIIHSWIRDVPALGEKSRQLQRMQLEGFIGLAQGLGREAARHGGRPRVSRESATILVGGLRELVATTVEDGRSVAGMTEAAVQAALALLVSD